MFGTDRVRGRASDGICILLGRGVKGKGRLRGRELVVCGDIGGQQVDASGTGEGIGRVGRRGRGRRHGRVDGAVEGVRHCNHDKTGRASWGMSTERGAQGEVFVLRGAVE